MNRPCIGIVPSKEGNTLKLNQDYLDAIWFVGGVCMVLPYTSEDCLIKEYSKIFDGVIFSGGGDIDPSYYNEVNDGSSKNICSLRDVFEVKLMRSALRSNKPILGICRGMQLINVFFGGKLNQDIKGHMQNAPRNIRDQLTLVCKESLLYNIERRNEIFTNSFHHQSVKTLGHGLEIDAVAADGCIEAIHAKEHRFCLGVQWHPENYFKDVDLSTNIFRSFVTTCRDNGTT